MFHRPLPFRLALAAALPLAAGTLSAQDEAVAVAPPQPVSAIDTIDPETRRAALEAYGWIIGMQSGALFGFPDDEIEHIIAGLRRARDPESPQPANLEGLMPAAQIIVRERRAPLEARAAAEEARAAAGATAVNDAYLAEVDAREGVQRTESGLRYEILQEGVGRLATAADTVRLHYHGTLSDGTVFDSSVDRGEPATFPVGGVIPGFAEGVQLVREGGKARLVIPPSLGYGDRPAGRIPPNSVLTFEIEILEVIPGS